ncbi:oligosaccharide flippase family protein [Neobacillus rhizophilus]|uniref:Oligosaccharide flippase family protein n=1 Tax=Neobacillus rhizophilus TaxID=2833579 RepID=A0A942U946_9BACI|nr:oligosaccharide flippase family protein [Neobacillus rhizophilus]MBS4213114.1 oligosaccharide flippase family protein [Neobacillus rhizophilus]MBU8914763.1 oligosaccharide flippase family protein [Bacillus sp. FJAT-29953]
MGKLISNYLFTVVYQLLIVITPFITTPYVSRVLKPEGVGTDAYVLSIVQLFIVFAALSIPIYGSRQIATKLDQNERSKEFWSIYCVQLSISLLTTLCYVIFIFTVADNKMLFFIHIFTLIATTIDISWYFIGMEQIKSITMRNILIRVVSIILIFTLVKSIEDLSLYILINASTLFMGQLIMWIPLLKVVSFKRTTFRDIKVHIAPIISLFLPQIMIQVYILVNKIVLGHVSGKVEVGYYNQADKVIRIALGFITSLGSVLLPRMAKEFALGNIDSMKKYINYALQFVLMITLPMTLGLMAISSNFVTWFLGNEFKTVINLLNIMSPVIFFVGLANIFGIQILVSTNQNNKYAVSITIGALLSLIANILLVSYMASTATTIALLVAEASGAMIQMYFARKYFELKTFSKMFTKYFCLSILVYFSVSVAGSIINVSPFLLTFIQLFIAAVVYLAGLIVVKDSIVFMIFNKLNNKLVIRGR